MNEQDWPAGSSWRTWPILPGMAGYDVVDLDPPVDLGLTSPRPHAMVDAHLVGHGVCAERGASVQPWFGQFFTATSGDDWTIRFREQPGTKLVVVTGERTRPEADPVPPRPIVAFRIERDGAWRLLLRVAVPPLAVAALLVSLLRRSRRSSA
jgi:hypothetical protein